MRGNLVVPSFELESSKAYVFEPRSFVSGETQLRYKHLVQRDNLPFVRASDSGRVVQSAKNWTSGFALASHNRFRPKLSVVISEESNSNNTLDDNLHINAGDSSPPQSTWTSIFSPPIRARLNKAANRDLNLTNADIPELVSLCAFDSVAKEKLSEWCSVWTEDEMESFDYCGDLDKFYGTGYGQPLGPAQGVSYINELIARLTTSPVVDSTQTNTTLDSSPVTFPLDRSIYADFSHDNQMIAIYAAIGLFDVPVPLDPTSKAKRENRGWKTRKMMPLSGRMVVERMSYKFGTRWMLTRALLLIEFSATHRETKIRTRGCWSLIELCRGSSAVASERMVFADLKGLWRARVTRDEGEMGTGRSAWSR